MLIREITESPIDRALSVFLTERSGLDGSEKERFAEIIFSLSRALGEGHICIELNGKERGIVSKSRIVSTAEGHPLVLFNSRLYLSRYFSYESSLVENIQRIAALSYELPDLDELLDLCFPRSTAGPDYQREAAAYALSRALTIISGGPGTGKTTTIVKIVGLLLHRFGRDLRIALAAPTGKAAIRMGESIRTLIPLLPFADDVRRAIPCEAMTLHRLLGPKRFSPRFKHNRNNPLYWDVVLVDEASMVDLALMSKLVDGLKINSRLILLGDKDQLASVESGSVLADCIQALPENVVELKTSFRFDKEIAAFATSVNSGEDETAWSMLEKREISAISLVSNDWLDQATENYGYYMARVHGADDQQDYPELFDIFHRFRLLCAVRNGPRGIVSVNTRVESLLDQRGFSIGKDEWYIGRPVIITQNDYSTGLFNGDIGICLPAPEQDGALAVWFEQPGDGPDRLRCFPPFRLSGCETVWAMTIHKSQGSEFDEVLILLPDQDNQVLCRELLYTAVTRARKRVGVVAEEEIWRLSVKRKTRRYSGLTERLSDPDNSRKEITFD